MQAIPSKQEHKIWTRGSQIQQGIIMTSLQPLGSYHEPDPESLQKEQKIQGLIASSPTQQNIDNAADIAMTIYSKTVCHFALTDICRAYLTLSTFEGCRRAFWIAKKKEELGDHVQMLMNEVVGGCIKEGSP